MFLLLVSEVIITERMTGVNTENAFFLFFFMMNKYRAIRTVVDGITFHSKKEAKRYGVLKILQAAGEISELTTQPVIPLVVNGQTIGRYISDFRYVENGEVIIEDVKSKPTMTSIYRLKKRILATYDPPILIRETF